MDWRGSAETSAPVATIHNGTKCIQIMEGAVVVHSNVLCYAGLVGVVMPTKEQSLHDNLYRRVFVLERKDFYDKGGY